MGKSNIMHVVCGGQDFFAKKTIFDAGLFCKTFYLFSKHILSQRSRKFSNIEQNPLD
jgi:hypothetical protein